MKSQKEYRAIRKAKGRDKVKTVTVAGQVINETGLVILDTETTGLNSESELLQVSIIDGNGKTLFDSYIKPYGTESWKEAERINGITSKTVKRAPFLHEVASQIITAINSGNTLIGYNIGFDIARLKDNGIDGRTFDNLDIIDVMKEFAPIYGEWNEKRNCYKWQKLTTACKYYGYEFKAHDSLEDVKATLYVYKKIVEKK